MTLSFSASEPISARVPSLLREFLTNMFREFLEESKRARRWSGLIRHTGSARSTPDNAAAPAPPRGGPGQQLGPQSQTSLVCELYVHAVPGVPTTRRRHSTHAQGEHSSTSPCDKPPASLAQALCIHTRRVHAPVARASTPQEVRLTRAIHRGCWQSGHRFSPAACAGSAARARNQRYVHSAWKRLWQVPHSMRGSWPVTEWR